MSDDAEALRRMLAQTELEREMLAVAYDETRARQQPSAAQILASMARKMPRFGQDCPLDDERGSND